MNHVVSKWNNHTHAQTAEAMNISDPRLCYILDGFLGLYGLIVTGMFIKEKVSPGPGPSFRPDPGLGIGLDTGLKTGCYGYKALGDTLKEIPNQSERQNKEGNHEGTQETKTQNGLSSATRDTYDSLQMQPLPRH
uniref:T-cell surface glycoprotein CD3 zeta chain n=1 Tax=Nothobranchius furzeri TaxID=105023 RepID=A0A8C6MC62_NOTFU